MTFDLLRKHGNSVAGLREAIRNDPAVKAAAEAEIAALAGVHPDRCVVTKEYVQALREALA